MKKLSALRPTATFDALFPQGTVYAPRSTVKMTKWAYTVPMSLDTVTGNTITYMGRMPLICHRSVATPQILQFLEKMGHTLPIDMETYETEEQAIALALSRVQRGSRLAYVCPPPSALGDPKGLLIPVNGYNFFNDKSNMSHLVDPSALPARQFIPPERMYELAKQPPEGPVFLKVAYPGVSGGGLDVRYCPDTQYWFQALDWLSDKVEGITGVIVEKALDIRTCWCMHVGVLQTASRYLGAAIQLFDSPAKQSGSRIDPDDSPPAQAIELTLQIAERARKLGYLGVAGFDIGVTPQGGLFVFDLNFRLNGSTPQVLLHESATSRVGARVSQSWHQVVPGPLEPLLARITPFAETGRFVPTRFYEGTEVSDGKSMLTGFVVADTVEGAESLCAQLTGAVTN